MSAMGRVAFEGALFDFSTFRQRMRQDEGATYGIGNMSSGWRYPVWGIASEVHFAR